MPPNNSVCIISLARIIIYSRNLNPDLPDITWESGPTASWNAFEINVAIVCACLTTVKPVVARFFPRMFSEDSEESESGLESASMPGVSGPERMIGGGGGGGRHRFGGIRHYWGGDADLVETVVDEEEDEDADEEQGRRRSRSRSRSRPETPTSGDTNSEKRELEFVAEVSMAEVPVPVREKAGG